MPWWCMLLENDDRIRSKGSRSTMTARDVSHELGTGPWPTPSTPQVKPFAREQPRKS